ncbi:hypothetical protein P3T36_006345 [Kitasatospora sp. MAP12-15]|uniref:hypothetical protein n=1 Tax=unclassified Kitasatospora TaxID=2633591 RepID=UPI002475D1A6|nr:hypothetical protein [Kitasatospora sp. MAP12-44]MDH6107886.1 hypothetical protein [Kitasatospora sp. MAP12-44]
MSLARRAKNRAKHWADRQDAAATPQEKAAVMYDACRMVAANAELAGRPEVWSKLAETLQKFYADYTR